MTAASIAAIAAAALRSVPAGVSHIAAPVRQAAAYVAPAASDRDRRLRIAHVITSLGPGGAENMLLKLVTHTDPARLDHRVYCLTHPRAGMLRELEARGVPVTALGMTRAIPDPRKLLRLGDLLRRDQPDVVQTWMYHADVVGGLAVRIAGLRAPLVWNLRQSNLDPALNRRRTLYLVRLCAALSRALPTRIVCCSHEVQRAHAAAGYDVDRLTVIENGFDLSVFRPDAEARREVRSELGIPEDAWLIGMVARFDVQKDHRTFVQAAAHLHARRPDVRFILCGDRMTEENAKLMEWIDADGLRAVFHLTGVRADVPRVTAALDVASLSSVGEGFPNVLGEAMACGIPCVSTDVGGAAQIVGDTGLTVPPRAPDQLAGAWLELILGGREHARALGERARGRIEEHFSIAGVARTYESMYRAVIA